MKSLEPSVKTRFGLAQKYPTMVLWLSPHPADRIKAIAASQRVAEGRDKPHERSGLVVKALGIAMMRLPENRE